MTFRLLGLPEELRLAIEQAGGSKTEEARLIVEAAVNTAAAQVEQTITQSLREVQEIIGPHGSVSRLQAGGVLIDRTGISLFTQEGREIEMNADGIIIKRSTDAEGDTNLSMIRWVDDSENITAYIQDVSVGNENLFSIRKTREDGDPVTSSKIRIHLRNKDAGFTNSGVAIVLVADGTDSRLRLQMGAVDGTLYNAFSLVQSDSAVGQVIINADQVDMDFQVRGDTDANLIIADAGLDAVGIGGAAESGTKLKLYGKANFTPSPITTNMLTRDPDSVGAGTWARGVLNTLLYCGFFGNVASNADGDNFTVKFWLPAGTYKLRFNAIKNTNRGIVKVEVGATDLGNTDLYAAALDPLNVAEYTGISITTPGEYAVKFTLNGKNASSSDHVLTVEGIEFIRTA